MAMNRRNNKGGSLLRNIIIIAVIGVILVGGGVLSFLADQASRKSPLEIAPYPSAELWGYRNRQTSSREVYYKIRDASPDVVAEYYQNRLNDHTKGTEEACVRLPAEGEYPASELGPGVPPYAFRCLFDNSGFQSTQYTQVTVSPGLYNSDPEYNTEGQTVVQYVQVWQP